MNKEISLVRVVLFAFFGDLFSRLVLLFFVFFCMASFLSEFLKLWIHEEIFSYGNNFTPYTNIKARPPALNIHILYTQNYTI